MTYILEKISQLLVFKVNEKVNYTPGFIILGFLFPLLTWVVGFIATDAEVSFTGLWQMHKVAPVYFIVDLAPFILGLLGYILTKYHQDTTLDLLSVIDEKDNIINANARFAKKNWRRRPFRCNRRH
jgi:hypothetical protein